MDKLLRAIYFAAEKHNGQLRKDNKTPVITHLLSVALMLSRITKDENTIIAGILHDTLEDTNTSKGELIKKFGAKVAKLVGEVSEKDRRKGWEKRWKERKQNTLQKIRKFSRPAALILTADNVSNSSELLKNLETQGLKFGKYFHSSIEEKTIYDRKKIKELKKYHSNPLIKDLARNVKKTESIIKRLNK